MTKWSADGDKHDRRCIIVAIVVGGVATKLGYPALGIKMALIMITWGLLFSPDLDLADTGRWQSGGCKAWHRWKRAGLGWFWKPYGHAFKHRSVYSHTLIPGTLIRLLYVCLPFCCLYLVCVRPDISTVFKNALALKESLKALALQALFIFSSCFIADAVHLSTDNIPPKEWLQ